MLYALDNLYYHLTRPRQGGVLATIHKAIWVAIPITLSVLAIVLANT